MACVRALLLQTLIFTIYCRSFGGGFELMRDGQDKIGVWTMLEETMEYVFCSFKSYVLSYSLSRCMTFQSCLANPAHPVDSLNTYADSGRRREGQAHEQVCAGIGHRAQDARLHDEGPLPPSRTHLHPTSSHTNPVITANKNSSRLMRTIWKKSSPPMRRCFRTACSPSSRARTRLLLS